MQNKIIGIIGIGRLGSQIAKKLTPQHGVIITDKSFDKARQRSKTLGITHLSVERLVQQSDITILTVPPKEVTPLLITMHDDFKSDSIVVNMATSIDTKTLSDCVSRKDIRIVGMKPVTHAYGISQGLPTVFISSYDDQSVVEELADLLKPIGHVIRGDEMVVSDINATATDYALRLCIGLMRDLKQAGIHDDKVIEAALKSVAAGTILDYPPEMPNYYIEERLTNLFRGGTNDQNA